MMNKLNDANDIRNEVMAIAKEMNDCAIPVSIGIRRTDLEKVSARLDKIIEDF